MLCLITPIIPTKAGIYAQIKHCANLLMDSRLRGNDMKLSRKHLVSKIQDYPKSPTFSSGNNKCQ